MTAFTELFGADMRATTNARTAASAVPPEATVSPHQPEASGTFSEMNQAIERGKLAARREVLRRRGVQNLIRNMIGSSNV